MTDRPAFFVRAKRLPLSPAYDTTGGTQATVTLGVQVEIIPGERFVHMIETFFGLARLGHTNRKGMPHPLQLAPSAQEFSDVVVFRPPPRVLQRTMFTALAPITRWRGYRRDVPPTLAHHARAADRRSKRPIREIRAVGLIE